MIAPSNAKNVWIGRFTRENARAAIDNALARTLPHPDRAPRVIGVKINICDYRRAESGAITDPDILGALLDSLRARFPSARLAILENDATTLDIRIAYKMLGFERVAREHDAELRNVAEEPWVKKPVPGGIVLKELEVPAVLDECDLFVNFAKLKTNALTKTTGCLKNIFAFMKTKRKVILHGQIDEVLHDMNKVIIPDVCLIDGFVGQEGMGPAFGAPKRCELLIAGRNPVAVDACEARVMGFRPRGIRHIRMCHEAGLGPIDYTMDTDIPNFDYRKYKFEFGHVEYHLKNLLRSRAGIAT